MIIEIDGKKYELDDLQKQIKEAVERHQNESELLYGDYVWHLNFKKISSYFSVSIRRHIWMGTDREFQLLADNRIFRTETSAKFALDNLYDKINTTTN